MDSDDRTGNDDQARSEAQVESDDRASWSRRFEPVWMVARSDLRRRWSTVVVIGALLGLAGGLGVACLAGARRTSTVVHRHLVASGAPNLEIDPGSFSTDADTAVRKLPGVVDAGYWITFSAFKLRPDGRIDRQMSDALAFTTDGRYLTTDRVVVARGRRINPTAPNEVMVNEAYAKATHIDVGSQLPVGVFTLDDNGDPVRERPDRTIHATVVGIMVLNEEITSDELDTIPRLFVSPAAASKPIGRTDYYGFAWYGLRLAGGDRHVADVQQRWREIAAAHNAKVTAAEAGTPFGAGNYLTYFHLTSDLEHRAARAVRPLTTTLAAFGLLALLASVALAVQALARSIRTGQDELRISRVLGLTRLQAAVASMAVTVCAVGLAALLAGAAAVVASLLFPVGPFAVLDPHRGLDVDFWLITPTIGLLVVVSTLLLWTVALRSVARHSHGATSTPARRSRAAAMLGRSGASPSLAAAVRLTLEPGEGRNYVPTRSMLVSVALTVSVLATVLVFGSNLSALNHDPTRFGWPSDGVLMSDGGYGAFDQAKLTHWLDKKPEVKRWRLVSAGQARLAGITVPAVIFGPGYGGFEPTIVAGRAPERPGEVVLGAATMRAIHAELGDVVAAGSGRRRIHVRITGAAVFPVLGPVLAVRSGLDEGAWFDVADYIQLDNIQTAIDGYGQPDRPYYSLALYDLRAGASVAGLQDAIRTSGVGTGSSDDAFGVVQPSEVRTAGSAGAGTQLLLCGLLALAAGVSILLTLMAVVRRRRTELALYRILGFTPSQIRATLLGQGLIVGVVSLVFGVVVGTAAGRTLWRVFATHLGVVPDPSQPVLGLALAAVATLVLVMVASIGPAFAAARVPPAIGVKAE